EIVRGDHAAGRALGTVADAERRARDLLGDERLNQGAVARQILEVGPRHVVGAGGATTRAGHREEPVLVRDEREWTQEDPLDPAEDGGVGADAERQAQDRQERKSRAPPKHAEAVPKILNHGVMTLPNARSTRFKMTKVDDQTAPRMAPAIS